MNFTSWIFSHSGSRELSIKCWKFRVFRENIDQVGHPSRGQRCLDRNGGWVEMEGGGGKLANSKTILNMGAIMSYLCTSVARVGRLQWSLLSRGAAVATCLLLDDCCVPCSWSVLSTRNVLSTQAHASYLRCAAFSPTRSLHLSSSY